ncbi:MAG: hypothetical protein R3A79_07790 [Nannocystaceae bacterium]
MGLREAAIVGAWVLLVGGCARGEPSPRSPVAADALAPGPETEAPTEGASAADTPERAASAGAAPALDAAQADVAAPEPPVWEVSKPEPLSLATGGSLAERRARARSDRDNDVCVRPEWPEEGVIARPPVYWIEHRKLDSGDLEHDHLLLDLLKFVTELRTCHQQGVGQRLPPGDQSIRGRAAITLTIDATGRVVDAKVRFADRCVRTCIERSALDWEVTRWGSDAATGEITWRVYLGVAPDTSPPQYY